MKFSFNTDCQTQSYCNLFEFSGYTACECRASNDTCITPYGQFVSQLCSGHGTCECGNCKCDETPEGQYSGEFCEECPVSFDKGRSSLNFTTHLTFL